MKNWKLVLILYFFLATGGIWNALGFFQPLMSFLAPWLILLLGVGGVLFTAWQIQEWRWTILIWSVVVFLGSLIAEILGVNTGILFGSYAYGKNMAPFIWSTPIAIGGAWLSVLMASIFLTRRLMEHITFTPAWLLSILASLLAVGFDWVMEFAAVKLGYWSWHDGVVPIKNYLTWFVMSLLFSIPAFLTFAGPEKKVPLVWHLYFAQLTYFLISIF